MPSETTPLQAPPTQSDAVPCPRCSSVNTKFCYYNNYNLSQPRHFCKACRRYWTLGGTLRNVPVGGGTRKSSKRPRSSDSSTATTTSPASSAPNSSVSTSTREVEPLPVTAKAPPALKLENGDDHHGLSLSEKNEGFWAMLNVQGHGTLDPCAYGSGFGFGFCEMGIGRGVWPYPGLSYIGGGAGDGEGFGVVGESDGFSWPGLAVSAPGTPLK